MLREVVIDAPASSFDEVASFWAKALDATPRPVPGEPEFVSLIEPAALGHVGLQNIGRDDAPRFHLDIETDDVEAEVVRLTALGARVESRHPQWVVMRDPAGLLFCILPPESDEFEARARSVDP